MCNLCSDDSQRDPMRRAAFEDTGSIPVIADDNKPCDTCGKTHRPDDCAHSEVLS